MAYKRFYMANEALLEELQTDKAISDTDAVLDGTTTADLITTGEVIENQEDAKANEDTTGAADSNVPTDTNGGTDPEVAPDNSDTTNPEDKPTEASDDTPPEDENKPKDGEDTPPEEDEDPTKLSNEDQAEVAKENLEYIQQADGDGDTSLETSRAIDAEATEFSESLEIAADITHALESMQEKLKASLAYGGLKPKEVPIFKLAIEGITGGTKLPKTFTLSQESFTPSQRIKNTQLAMEWLREKVAAIWKYIIDLLKKVWNWLGEKLNFFFNIMDRNKKEIAKMRIALNKYQAPADKPNDTNFKFFMNGNVTRRLYCSALPNTWTIEQSIGAFSKASENFYGSAQKASKEIGSIVYRVINEKVDISSKNNILSSQNLLAGQWNKVNNIPGHTTPTYVSKNNNLPLEAFITSPMPGGSVIAAYLPPASTTLVEGINAISKSKIFFADDDAFKIQNVDVIEYLANQRDFSTAITMFETINNQMRVNLQHLNEARKNRLRFIELLNKQYQAAVKAEIATSSDSPEKLCGHLIHALISLYDRPIIHFSSAFNQYTSSLTFFIRASLARGL